jgi:ABC-type transporter Mla subunit MlaD
MEIKKPTPPGIEIKIFEEFESFAPQQNASQTASDINDRLELKKKLNDVITYARTNDASEINDLLEKNQTITEQKGIQIQVGQNIFETTNSTDEASQKVDPSVLSLLDQSLLAARFSGPMIKKLS